MEISSCEDEPAAMAYESMQQGRSAVAGQSSGGKAAAAARQGRAVMKAGRASAGCGSA